MESATLPAKWKEGSLLLITESQNHRIVGVGRDLCGSSRPTPLPKQGHPQQAAQDLVQAGLEYLQRRRLHNLPGQPGPGLRHPQREKKKCSPPAPQTSGLRLRDALEVGGSPQHLSRMLKRLRYLFTSLVVFTTEPGFVEIFAKSPGTTQGKETAPTAAICPPFPPASSVSQKLVQTRRRFTPARINLG